MVVTVVIQNDYEEEEVSHQYREGSQEFEEDAGGFGESQQQQHEQPSQSSSQLAIQRKQPQLADFPPPVAVASEAIPEQQEGFTSGGFTEDEVQNLRDIFDLFDKERSGRIDVKDLEAIMTSLQRDPSEARAMLLNSQGGPTDNNTASSVSFEEFLSLMQQVENKILTHNNNTQGSQDQQPSSIKKGGEASLSMMQQRALLQSGGGANGMHNNKGVISIAPDSKVLDFLRLLEEYRRKCEDEGNYAEARKAASKFEELLKKEVARQRNNIRAAQEHELANIEAAQKAQYEELSQAWDHYMSDYEAIAYLSLEILKRSTCLSSNISIGWFMIPR